MAETFKDIASEAIAEVQRLELANSQLRARLAIQKKAQASKQAIDTVVDKLCKCGCLQESDKQQASQLLANDGNAALRVIDGLCQLVSNADAFVKQASQDLHCGNLVNFAGNNVGGKIEDQAWAAVRKVLSSSY